MTGFVLTGGTVVDGTGAPPRRADVAVRDGRIRAVGVVRPDTSDQRIDVSGMLVCPGFVDIHTHSDLTLLSNPLAHSKIRQGVTTEVVGNCGLGVAPVRPGVDMVALRSAVAYLDLDPAVEWTWRSLEEYLEAVAAAQPSVNVATLVGHIPVRASVAGFEDRPASAAEIAGMADLLAEAFSDGAVGLSTGLGYAPLRAAQTDELIALGHVVAAYDRVFAWHLRDYADELPAAAAQAIEVAEATGCRTQISHLCAVGQRNWGKVEDVLSLVDGCASRGIDVGVDIYPYLAGNAPLSQLLPQWVTTGGQATTAEHLADADARARIRDAWTNNPVSWTEITVASGSSADVLGRTIAELAEERSPADVVMDLLAEFGNNVMMTAGGRSEQDLLAVLSHRAGVVASDGLALDPDGPTGKGLPHPRSYGCFPRLLARYAGTEDLPWALAVHKATAAPARRMGIVDRGEVRAGLVADLVVLDGHRLVDGATFTDPHRFGSGVELVYVGGTMVIDNGRHTGARPGTVLRPVSTARGE